MPSFFSFGNEKITVSIFAGGCEASFGEEIIPERVGNHQDNQYQKENISHRNVSFRRAFVSMIQYNWRQKQVQEES